MDKNLFFAILLSVLVYIAWFTYMDKRYGHLKPQKPVAGQKVGKASRADASTAQAPAAPAAAPAGAPKTAPRAARKEGGPALSAPEPTPEPKRGGLDGALPFSIGDLSMKIQPLGASIVSFKYPGPLGAVELVPYPYPGFFATWPGLKFEQTGADKNWPAFEAAHPSGVRIRKEYLFQELGGMNTLRLVFTNPGGESVSLGTWGIELGPGMGTVHSKVKENPMEWGAAALLPPGHPRAKKKKSGTFLKYKLKRESASETGPWRWLGVHNSYFLSAVFPPDKAFGAFSHGALLWKKEKGFLGREKEVLIPWLRAEAREILIPPGGTVEVDVPFYFGPKGYTRLKRIGLELEESVYFGWKLIDPLGRVALRVLELFHSWVGNWGWAIIMMTFCLQIVLFPLTYKQMKSMAVMKKVQPEVQRVQQKYAKDPRRMQVEMMEIYKKHGANPLGGCLPLLVQFPVLIALFNMLRAAWELHGAPWIFWIHDLSAHDPFYVLPVVMGGIMFLQSKMNPTPSTDPTQAKIMTYMPVIFTFFFLNFPAGLVLYWLTNSLLSFGVQLGVKKRFD